MVLEGEYPEGIEELEMEIERLEKAEIVPPEEMPGRMERKPLAEIKSRISRILGTTTKKIALSIIIALLILVGSLSLMMYLPPEKEWIKIHGGSSYEGGDSIFIYDGYIYVAGHTFSFGNGESDAWLLKYNLDGDLVWNITWGGSDDDWAEGVFVYGSNIYVTGYTRSFSIDYNIFVLKYDLDGNLIWSHIWGWGSDDHSMDIFVYDNYIYVVGYTESLGAGSADIYLLKFDLDGNLLWNVTWGGNNWDVGSDIFVYDNNIYVVGSTESRGAGKWDVCLLKFDLDGNLIWNITWGGKDDDGGTSIFIYNNYIYLVGSTYSFGAGESDICLLKYRLDGTKVREITWGGASWDYSQDIFVYSDSIYIVGDTRSFGAGGSDICLLKYSNAGMGVRICRVLVLVSSIYIVVVIVYIIRLFRIKKISSRPYKIY